MATQSNAPLDASLAEQGAPDMAPKLATTFGIEFECVLAFHESELYRVLEENNIVATVRKDLLREEHTALLGDRKRDSHRRSHFPSWGLDVPADDLAIDKLPMYSYGRLRPYFVEPLLIAQNVLKSGQCPTNVIGYTAPGPPIVHSGPQDNAVLLRHKDIDYDQWTLTYDWSIPGATNSELSQNVSHRIDELNRREWDSWGIELVTRKFNYTQKKEAFEEISHYLSTLKGDQSRNWAAFESVWAGTHVHVGLDIQAPKEISQPKIMRFLQHLAYILISYEELLSQLHPIHRSSDGRDHHTNRATSPTMRLEGETEDAQAERTARAAAAAHRSHKELGSNAEFVAASAQRAKGAEMLAWSDMRDILFQEKLRIDPFIEMLQDSSAAGTRTDRAFFVNFANLSNYRFSETKDKPIKPTIEFRQHACSLDADEMQHWVNLLFAIMRVAEARVAQTTKFRSRDAVDEKASFAEREGSKYRINGQWHRSTIEEFCGSDLLDLDRVECEYWKRRYEMYKRDLHSLPWEGV
jgi:hypothetical protein